MEIVAYVCRMDRNRSRCADKERKEEKIPKMCGGGDRYFNGSVALWVLNFFCRQRCPCKCLLRLLVGIRTGQISDHLNSGKSLDLPAFTRPISNLRARKASPVVAVHFDM